MNARKSIKTSKLSIAAFHEEPFLSQVVNSQNKPFYCYVYKITNLKEGLFYFGAHKTIKLNDGYASSSVNVRKDINRLGPENFKKEVVKFFNTSEEMFRYEEEMIRKVLGHPNCYNRGVTPECKIKNCVLVKDSEENFYYVKVDDPRIGKTLFYSGIGKVSVMDKDGNTFQTSIDDPRYVSGELRFFREGKKWMHKGNKKIQVDPDKVDKKLKEGWKLGSMENGYYWVTKDGINKKIEKPLLEEYLKAGWRKGATQIKKRWVTKDNISKSVLESEYENYLKDGWKPGMKTNLRWMVSPDGIRKMIKPEDIDSYLDKGWILTPQGKKKNKN